MGMLGAPLMYTDVLLLRVSHYQCSPCLHTIVFLFFSNVCNAYGSAKYYCQYNYGRMVCLGGGEAALKPSLPTPWGAISG